MFTSSPEARATTRWPSPPFSRRAARSKSVPGDGPAARPAPRGGPSSPAKPDLLGSALALMASLVTAATLLAGCGGGGSNAGPPPAPAPEGALAGSAPGELLAYVKARLAEREVQRRTNPGISFGDTAGAPIWLATVTTAAGTAERSGTTVQEAGVDEDDLIKSDGNLIATLAPQRGVSAGNAFATLQLYRPAAGDGTRPDALGRVTLTAPDDVYPVTHGMYLAAEHKRVAVLAESSSSGPIAIPDCRTGEACITLLPYPGFIKSQVQLQLVDITDPTRASVKDRVQIDGRLIGSRQIGRMLYLVTSHAPQFAVERLPATATAAEREATLARMAPEDFLPKWAVNGATARPMVQETQCFVQPANASLDLSVTTITAIDLAAPEVGATHRCFVGGSEALYMSPTNLYLATLRYGVQTMQTRLAFAPETRTDIHKFAVTGSLIEYRATGQVNGHLGWDREKAPYRMSEHNGDLRVLSFTGQLGWIGIDEGTTRPVAPSPATLTILRESTTGRTLDVVSTLPNAQRPAAIGLPGEQVYAVRFLGDRGYVVTFRQIDPLYVLDLSNPQDPKIAGELKMPGFSDYLYPLSGGKLFGVGKDADENGRLRGLKIALFDVADANAPKQLAAQTLGGPGSYSGLDSSRHALSMLERGSVARVALPVALASVDGRLSQQGLLRIEADTAAGTLTTKPLIPTGPSSVGWFDLSGDRSLQIGDQLYYLSQGALGLSAW